MSFLDHFAVVDFKTSGFSESDVCISCTIVNQDGLVLLDTLIKPREPLSIAPIDHFHDITQDRIDEYGVNYSEFVEKIREILFDYSAIIMYNADFDKNYIPSELLVDKVLLCCMVISVGFINNNPYFQPTSNYLKLNNVAALLEIDFYDLNLLTSKGDAELCRRVWLELGNDRHNLEVPFAEIINQYTNFKNEGF